MQKPSDTEQMDADLRRYWILCAGDKLHANATSIVGSIGVIAATFGAVDLIKRVGLERRVLTAGVAKSQLDPFM